MLAAVAALTLVATPIDQLKAEAAALSPLAETPLVRRWLGHVGELKEPTARVIFRDRAGEYLSVDQATALPRERQGELRRTRVPASFYYTTRYGSPLAYGRLLDFAALHGLRDLRKKKVLDFGFGTVGHLQLLAHAGAEAHGIEVDSMLQALYSQRGDTGKMGGGSVHLHYGFFPSDAKLGAAVEGGYDLITSKNTLKRGYIHPERPAPKEQLIDLGVDDATFLREIHSRLRPGGLFVVYNLSPRPAPLDKPYIPWADGRFPFSRALTEAAGFEVLAWDKDDLPRAQAMGRALGWDKSGMDVEKNLTAEVTVLRRRR
ncbi:MAG: class I SAM-dependent methyltransferase [Fimbriimonas sp.]